MSDEHGRPGEIIPLPAGKGLHVFHGGDLSGVGLERAGARRFGPWLSVGAFGC